MARASRVRVRAVARCNPIHHPGILCENWGILKWWPPKTNCPRSIDWPMVITKYSNKAEEWAKNTNRLLLSSSFPPPWPPGSSNKIEGRRTSVYPSPPQILAQGFVGIQKVNNTRARRSNMDLWCSNTRVFYYHPRSSHLPSIFSSAREALVIIFAICFLLAYHRKSPESQFTDDNKGQSYFEIWWKQILPRCFLHLQFLHFH